MSRRPHPLLADVAAAAGVSASTASRALRDSALVHERTRRRVKIAARRLGYEPDRIASSLRTRSTSLIGVIVPDIGTGFYARVVKGAQTTLERAGLQVVVMSTHRDPERESAALRTLLAHRVGGILLATSGGFDQAPRVPIVFFDNLVAGAGVANVARANHEGMALLVDHLAGHGHSRIAYIGGPPRLTSGTERAQGFDDAIRKRGLPDRPEYRAFGDEVWSARSGGACMRSLLELPTPPNAMVAASDTLSLGAIGALRDLGRTVPGDLAVVSFDDPFFGDLLDPPMTAIRRNDEALGELSASLLLHALETGGVGPPTEVRLPVELVIRCSCGCRPRL